MQNWKLQQYTPKHLLPHLRGSNSNTTPPWQFSNVSALRKDALEKLQRKRRIRSSNRKTLKRAAGLTAIFLALLLMGCANCPPTRTVTVPVYTTPPIPDDLLTPVIPPSLSGNTNGDLLEAYTRALLGIAVGNQQLLRLREYLDSFASSALPTPEDQSSRMLEK